MPQRPRIQIPDLCLAEMLDHAACVHPQECCGLLLGTRGETYQITIRIPLTNHLRREDEFESTPEEMLAAHRLMRQTGLELLAVYHSHPHSLPIPSKKDRERSISPEVAAIIIGPNADVRAWWLIDIQHHEPADLEEIAPLM